MSKNNKMIHLMNDYDSSEPLPASFSTNDLSAIAKTLNSGNQNTNVKIPSKIINLIKIIRKCVNNINVNLLSNYPDAKPFVLDKNITFNSLSSTGKIELVSQDKVTHLSFNIKKLEKLSSLELVAVIEKAAVDALAKINNKSEDLNFVDSILNNSDEKSKEDEKFNDIEMRAKEIIAAYLKSYLPTIYADDFKKFDSISNYIASLIVQELGEKDLNKILSPFFDFESLDIDVMAVEKVDTFLGSARITRLYGKATQLAENPEKEILSLGFMEQAQALLGTDSTDSNYHNLAKKFEASGGLGEKFLTSSAVKEFCLYYVQNYLHASNVKIFEVTFEPKGALGSYRDKGAKQSININLEKLRKMGSFTELAMTLSHELTHAVDSTKNKKQEIYNEFGGGLIGDIENSIAGSGATGEAKELLVSLKKFCYHINPNERRARVGELSALLFMRSVGLNNDSIKKEMNNSVNRYVKYQQTTIDMIKVLPQKISEFNNIYSDLLASGEVKKSSVASEMIKSRISYLEANLKDLSFEEEVKSQETARKILEGSFDFEQNQQQINNQNDLNRQKELERLERQL